MNSSVQDVVEGVESAPLVLFTPSTIQVFKTFAGAREAVTEARVADIPSVFLTELDAILEKLEEVQVDEKTRSYLYLGTAVSDFRHALTTEPCYARYDK